METMDQGTSTTLQTQNRIKANCELKTDEETSYFSMTVKNAAFESDEHCGKSYNFIKHFDDIEDNEKQIKMLCCEEKPKE
jgi:hypothetical protein